VIRPNQDPQANMLGHYCVWFNSISPRPRQAWMGLGEWRRRARSGTGDEQRPRPRGSEHRCAGRQGRTLPATGTAAAYRRDLLRVQARAGADTDIAPNEPRFGPTSPLFSL